MLIVIRYDTSGLRNISQSSLYCIALSILPPYQWLIFICILVVCYTITSISVD